MAEASAVAGGSPDTAAAAGDLVGQLLRREQETPDQPWLFQPVNGVWHSLTWAQAARQVRCMAAALRSFGYPPGSRICISGRNTAHWVMADLAIMLAGHVPVGLYPRQSAANTRYIIEHAEARAIFLGPALDAAITAGAVPDGVLTIGLPYPNVPSTQVSWDELVAEHPPMTGHTPPAPQSLALLLYTSGTSGPPKGVMLTYGNIAFVARHALAHVFKPRGKQRLLSYLPLAHAQERLTCESLSLLVGAEVHFLESIEAMGATLARVAPTFFTGGPHVYARMQAGILQRIAQRRLGRLLRTPLLGMLVRRMLQKKIGLHCATLCIVGGAPMSRELIEWFALLGIEVQQGYGLTENCGYIACNLPGAHRPGSVGRILPGAQVRLGADGEIQCRHDGTMQEYYRDPALTREAFTADGYFRTGDAGVIDADGYLYVTGRIGDMLQMAGGRLIAPAAIEAALGSPMIEQACLAGTGLPQPVLLLGLSRAARQLPRAEVERHLTATLEKANAALAPHEKVVRAVIVKDTWLPDNGYLTPTMKMRRRVIEHAYAALIDQAHRSPATLLWEEPALSQEYGRAAAPLPTPASA